MTEKPRNNEQEAATELVHHNELVTFQQLTKLHTNIDKDLQLIPPEIVSRKERHAKKPKRNKMIAYKENEPLDTIYTDIVIHHSLTSGPDPKHIQEMHLEKGYADIGYHFIIGQDGTIYAGRDIGYIGAHAGETLESNTQAQGASTKEEKYEAQKKDPDFRKIGICLIGNFNRKGFTEKQTISLELLLTHLQQTYLISKNNILGHIDIKNLTKQQGLTLKTDTDCPGSAGKQCISEICKKLPNDTEETIKKYAQQK